MAGELVEEDQYLQHVLTSNGNDTSKHYHTSTF